MKLASSRFKANPLPDDGLLNNFAAQAADLELTDLVTSLKAAGTPDDRVESIRATHKAERQKLTGYVNDHAAWEDSGEWVPDDGPDGGHRAPPQDPEPQFPVIKFVDGLPDEFGDYFEGAVIWNNPMVKDKEMARAAWERLLARPAEQRKFKSTWAAYMIAKSWEPVDPDKAIQYYRRVRELAGHGCADTAGLAPASLGYEARINARRGHFKEAIHLYLDQFATGDPTAANSLRFTAAAALKKAHALDELAADRQARDVITAYLVSSHGLSWAERDDDLRPIRVPATAWLNAVEKACVIDVNSAEKLALAAYQAGEFDLAQRWAERAPGSPVAQWVEAKLLLRDGKTGQAAVLLARVCRSFPLEPLGTNAPVTFADNLFVRDLSDMEAITAGQEALGELGALHLARCAYVESLDALLRSGFWQDAAYVAERVLTADELKNYVDNVWSPTNSIGRDTEAYWDRHSNTRPEILAADIRYLLARRLARLNRLAEAREYYPPELQPRLDLLAQDLSDGRNENAPADARAKMLFNAAVIVRTNGMELMGTEVEPDWSIYGGDYEEGVSVQSRTNNDPVVLAVSDDEFKRVAGAAVEPEERFHYRYRAAALAFEAAKLMPNNSDDTARVLCRAGTWLKYLNPKAADVYYKALVRRCRKTAIGDQADRMRWFPVLDPNGNPIPWQPDPEPAPAPVATPDETGQENSASGQSYTINAGDSILSISKAAGISIEDLMNANPELDTTSLKVGQVIVIPSPTVDGNDAPINAVPQP